MSSDPLDLNPEFLRAIEFMENSPSHCLITGRAGTGKSTLLDYFRGQTKKKIAVLAPTGVAAVNVKGQTVHSFFRFKPNITPEEAAKKGKRAQKKEDESVYQNLDAVIIDEISMVRADLLDCVDSFLKACLRKTAPFGGVRMIFIGDLYQLPPVLRSEEKPHFEKAY